MQLRRVTVTRYIQPLREGGSLPALAEADDGFKYVLKFKGTGHGVKTLISELVGGEVARVLGLRMPELVFADLDEAFGRTEGDEEIQDLLKASQGLNLGLHFLSGAITYDPAVNRLNGEEAALILALDWLLLNVDRSFRNTNLLMWNRACWLIDHGSCLYFQYNFETWEEKTNKPFAFIKDHVLLSQASDLKKAAVICSEKLTDAVIDQVVALIPDEWLLWPDTTLEPWALRAIYGTFLKRRVAHLPHFEDEIEHARKALV